MDTGSKIKRLREQADMTQEELGKLLGVKRAAINKYESGLVVNLKGSTIEKLCKIFNVTPQYLLTDDECFTDASKTLTLVPAKSASAPQHAPDLPPDEQRLLDIYRDLSDDGKAVLLNYADDMSHLGKYKKRTPDERQSLAKTRDNIGGKQ